MRFCGLCLFIMSWVTLILNAGCRRDWTLFGFCASVSRVLVCVFGFLVTITSLQESAFKARMLIKKMD